MGTTQGPIILLLLALTAYTLADSSKCKAGCNGAAGTIFRYDEGSTYTYSVEGTTITSLTGAKGDATKLSLKATAELSVTPNCAHFIKLSGVSITGPDGKKYDSLKELEKNPFRFNFHDGHIDTEICTVEGDSQAALNAKRAIASLFQVAASHTFGSTVRTEVDVFGSCPTQFSFSKDGDVLSVRKERNLNRCAHRENFRSDILSVGYSGESPLQNTPIMASSMKVTQKIKNGVIDSAESSEEYFYRPYSNRDAGAKTVVETKIKLTGSKKQAPANTNVSKQRSLIFDVPHVTTVPGNADAIVKAVNKAHENMQSTVGESSANDFSNVIQVLRQSTKDDILKAYNQVSAKKILLDALMRAGTGEAIEAGVELIKKKDIKELGAQVWYMSLSFVRHATPGSLAAVASLIDANSPRGLILGAGALAGRFCREHDCENKAEFNTLVGKLSAPLGSGCNPKDKEDENKIIASLKALHNIHHLTDGSVKILATCASDIALPARIRVSALEAFHGGACIPKLRETALKVLKNIDEDSEIRIKAYLALVDCPNGEVANALKEMIDSEPSSQVGAFIVSHLRNIRASANPDKALAKAQLGNIKPRQRFPNDLRKFSRNFEVSTLIELLNIGASVESNVIFSQRSFMPRSASLNLTTDIFGHSINLMELGIRAENLDRVLEHIFGPKGFVRSNDVKDMFSESKDRLVSLAEKVSQRFAKSTRGKRAVSRDQINAVSKKVSLGPKEFDSDVDIDLSVRVFGLESVWLNYQGNRQITPDSVVDKLFDSLDSTIDKAKKFDYDIRKHVHFLDTELIYPTSLGLPLKLASTGNAALHLKLDGNIDIHSILKDPKNAQAKLHVVPSAAVELRGVLTVDAIVVESGLKLTTTLHTTTGSDVTVKVLDGSGIDVNFGLPIPKQDLFTLKSEIFSFKQEKGQAEVDTPLTFTTKRKDYHGCFDQLSPIVGITFCTEVGFPAEGPSFNAAFFPLNGPAKISVSAEMDDPSMTGYRFKAQYDKKPSARVFEILLDTPGSKVNRKLGLTMEGATSPEHTLKIALASPWKKLAVEGHLVDNDKNSMLVGKLINDKSVYSVKVGVDVTGSPEARTYAPVLEYNAPGQKAALTGKDGKKQPINIEGTITIEKKGDTYRKVKFNAMSLSTPMGKFGIDGSITRDKDLVAHDLKLSHDKNKLSLDTKLERLGENNYKAHVEAVPAQFPDFSFAVDWDYKRTADHLENNLAVTHGANLKAVESRLTLNQDFKYKIESISSFDVSTKQKLTYPILGVDTKFDGSATRKNVNYDLLAKYDNKKLESKLNAKADIKAVGDYDVTFMAKINDKGVAFSSKRDKPAADKSKLQHTLELTPGGKYELTSDVTYTFEKNNIKYQGEHLLKLAQQPDIKMGTGLVYNPNHLDSHFTVTYGDIKYLDTMAKLDRNAGSPAGSYKIIIKDIFDSHGDMKYAAGKGSGSFVIDVPKVQRKIKGSADIAIAGSNYKANADLLWNADKDPKQKFHIDTDTDFTGKSLKSKNNIVIMDWKTVANLKRDVEGSPKDGSVNSEVELTVPSGRKFLARYSRDVHVKPAGEKSSGGMTLLLEDHNEGKVRSTSFNVAAKDIDAKHGAFDANAQLTYKSPSGKDLSASVVAKNIYNGEQKWTSEGKVDIKGSYLPKSIEGQFNSEYSKNKVTYKLVGHGFTGVEYNIDGTVITGLDGGHNRQASTSVDIKLPFDYIKQIKFKSNWNLAAQEGSPCQVGVKHLMDMYEKLKAQKGGMKLASTLSLLAPNLVPSCELKAHNELTWNDKTLKFDGGMKADLRRGAAKVILTLPEDKPRSLMTDWVQFLDQDSPKVTSSVSLGWDGSKNAKVEFMVEGLNDLKDVHTKVSGTTNVNEKHSFEVEAFHKRKNEHAVNTDVSVALDSKKVRVAVDLDRDQQKPKFDVKVEHPGGTSRFNVKADKKSEKDFKAEGNIQWALQGGGKLDWELDTKVESVDSFDIKGKIDSEQLKLKNYQIEIANKPGDKKQISFSCKSGDQNIVSGSTNYEFKEEGKTWTMEGSGSVQIKSEARSSHFKYSRSELNLAEDKELGVVHKLDVDFGGKESIQIERKSTNRQQRLLDVYCDKDKKCARIEFDDHTKAFDFVDFQRDIKIVVDLKSLGLPHDFSFNAGHKRHGRIVDIESELNLNSGAEKTSISSKVYAHETSAGAILNLPKRTIEALASLEASKANEGSFKGELALWLDKKRQPNLKSAIILQADVARSQNGGSISGGARLVHPDTKEMAVSGRLDIGGPQDLLNANIDVDVFADKKQKIVMEAKVAALEIPSGRNLTASVGAKSKALNLDVELNGHVALSPEVVSYSSFVKYEDPKLGSRAVGIYTKLSKEKFISVVVLPGAVLLKVKSDLKLTRDVQSFDTTIDLFGLKPIAIEGEIKDWNSVITSIYRKDDPTKKLSLKGGFAWGQVAEVRATKQSGDKKDDLFHVTIALDESHFLQTEYGGSLDNVKHIIDEARKEGSAFVNQAKIQIADAVLEGNKDIRSVADEVQKAKPNLKPMMESYQKELKAIADELANEKLAKEITEFIKDFLGRVTAIIDKVTSEMHKYVQILEKPLKQLTETMKQLITKLGESYAQFAEIGLNAFNQLMQAVGQAMSKVLEIVRAHEEDIKKVATVVGQSMQDIGRGVGKAVGQIRHEVEEFVKVFMEQLKAQPIYEVLKERYAELKKFQIPEQSWTVVHEMIEAFIASMPTKELSEFVKSISDYIEKHLKQEKVNEVEELKKISKNAINAAKSVVALARAQISSEDLDKIISFTAVPMPGASWFQLPIFAPIHFSPLKWLRSGDLPSLSEAYYTYRPTLNPLDWIPPYKMYGILVDSHNFYTFDRKYYNFKGACSYVMAQDFVDGNFSLIVNLEGGKFKSILLNDAKDSIELLSDMSILVNGKPQDFPALQGDLTAWRRYDSANIRSRSGVFVTCDMHRQVCQFFLSGFYFGKTRGLLGNMNYEQFDDLVMPNGKVASKVAEFGNSWKVNSECSDVPHVEHDHQKESYSECSGYFSGNSPLSSCFPYVNPAAFRTACDHAATEAKTEDLKKKAACNLAFAYTQACQYDHIKMDIPSACASCSAGANPVAVGDTVSVKSPQTMADIILVVEQVSPNEEVFKELVAPLIGSLSNDLKSKGITDVHFSLLGFGAPQQKWPSHFTSGGDLSFDGKTKNIWFGAPSTIEKPLDTMEKKLKWIKHQIDLETGNLRLVDAFTEASEFPFRAGAVKSIVGVMGQPCESSLLPISLMQIRAYIASFKYRDQGISLHIISPLDKLALDNDKQASEIVGFDSEHVFTIGDAKKKPLAGSTELRPHLQNESDVCIKVALGSYGSAFSSHNFLASKPAQRKQFVSIVSQRVTDSLASGEVHQDCKCSLHDGLHPKMNCRVTSRTEKNHG